VFILDKLLNRFVSPAVKRFEASMQIDYNKWHDGVGYDIDIIHSANAAERAEIDALLARRGAKDWRDVEALAALGASAQLRRALASSDFSVALAVLEHAPQLVSEAEAVTLLTRALREAEIGEGFAKALRIVERFHPPAIIDAMLRAVLVSPNPTLIAAMLLYLHGHAKEPFDYDQMPFLSRFHGDQKPAALRELCQRIGVRPPE